MVVTSRKLRGQRRQAREIAVGIPNLERNLLSLDIAQRRKSLAKRHDTRRDGRGRGREQQADAGQIRTLLRAGDSRRRQCGKPPEKRAPGNH